MTRSAARRIRWAGLALLAVVGPVGTASAMTILPVDLPVLTEEAERIFVGRVDSVATGRDQHGLPAVWTTFRVDEALKGVLGERVTVKQLATALGGPDAPVVARGDVPSYRRGEDVLLFVHADSTLGFASPVGLGQGCFRIRERDGQRVVENDVGNRNLLVPPDGTRAAGAPTDPAAARPLPLDPFLARVRTLVGSPD